MRDVVNLATLLSEANILSRTGPSLGCGGSNRNRLNYMFLGT